MTTASNQDRPTLQTFLQKRLRFYRKKMLRNPEKNDLIVAELAKVAEFPVLTTDFVVKMLESTNELVVQFVRQMSKERLDLLTERSNELFYGVSYADIHDLINIKQISFLQNSSDLQEQEAQETNVKASSVPASPTPTSVKQEPVSQLCLKFTVQGMSLEQ